MRPQLLIGGLVLILGALIASWFFATFEYTEYRDRVGFRGEARRNPYLAADKFLNRRGMPAHEMRNLAGLVGLPKNGVLIISEEREILTPQLRQALLSWVAQGGYLITEDMHYEKSDPLLDEFKVRREPVDEDDDDDDEEDSDWPLVEMTLPDTQRVLKVQMHEWQSVERDESIFYARSERANHVLHFRHGDGYVTVLNSMWFMHNAGIGEHDHAEFLQALLRLAPQRSEIAFFNRPEDLSLWSWLIDNAAPVLAASALALVLWLWRIIPRFAAIAPDPGRRRRSLLEHLRACGRFEWAAQGGPQLREAAREAAWRRVARAHPELAGMSTAQAAAHIAQLFNLHENDVQRLLLQKGPVSEHDFLRSIQIYQRIHAALKPRDKSLGQIISGEQS